MNSYRNEDEASRWQSNGFWVNLPLPVFLVTSADPVIRPFGLGNDENDGHFDDFQQASLLGC